MQSSKYLALVRLLDGEEAKAIATDLDVSYGTVLRYKRELNAAEDEGKVNSLLAAEQSVLDNIASNVVTDLPVQAQEGAAEEAAAVLTGVVGLKRLEGDLQHTAHAINTRIRLMTSTVESVHDIVDLSDALCKIQNAFFGKGTQVNIQNNVGQGEAYGQYLSDAPGE